MDNLSGQNVIFKNWLSKDQKKVQKTAGINFIYSKLLNETNTQISQ